MTASGPDTWARRILTATVTALLLVLGTSTALADPQPGPTTITVDAQISDDSQVVATGQLTDADGTPVPGAPVEARLNSAAMTQGTTQDDGSYELSFAVPGTAQTGEQQLVVVFDGMDDLDASQAATNISADQASSPQPKASPTDTRLDVFLDVSIAPATVTAGGLVTIEGTLTDENSDAIEGARISVLVDDEESMDSRVQTDDAGSFRTFAEIPSGRSAGPGSLVVSFAGNDSYTPGLKPFDVTVKDLPADDDDAAEATPDDTAAAQESASAEASAPATALTTDGADAVVDPSPLSWFYVALIVVGGIALLIAAGLVFRAMYGGRDNASSQDDGDIDRLLAPDPGAEDEEGAFLSQAFGEVDEDGAPDLDETQELPEAHHRVD